MAYNRPYNPDELPRFAEPEQKGPNKAPAPLQPTEEYRRRTPAPVTSPSIVSPNQNFRPQQPHQHPHPHSHSHPHPHQQYTSPPPQQQQQQQYRPPVAQRPMSPAVPPRDHYYNDRPGPSLPSGPRGGGNTLPPPRSPMPPHLAPQPISPPPAPVMFQTGETLSREQLVRLFRDLDKQARGFVTEVQLAETLVNGDATKFDPVTVNMMVRMFDSNRNGELEFDEFVGLWRFLEKWCDIFNKFDADHSGTISLSEFKAALVSFQYRLSDSFVEFIFLMYDNGRKGVITFDIFMQSCITLKRMTDIFKKYDDDRDGFIIINFEDFVTEFLRQLQKMTAPLNERKTPQVP